jgi:hypothetical protein
MCVLIIGLVKCFAQFRLASLFSPKTHTSRNCSADAKCKNPSVGTAHHQAQKSINIHESRPSWKLRDLPSGETMKDSRSICGLRYFCSHTNKMQYQGEDGLPKLHEHSGTRCSSTKYALLKAWQTRNTVQLVFL